MCKLLTAVQEKVWSKYEKKYQVLTCRVMLSSILVICSQIKICYVIWKIYAAWIHSYYLISETTNLILC